MSDLNLPDLPKNLFWRIRPSSTSPRFYPIRVELRRNWWGLFSTVQQYNTCNRASIEVTAQNLAVTVVPDAETLFRDYGKDKR